MAYVVGRTIPGTGGLKKPLTSACVPSLQAGGLDFTDIVLRASKNNLEDVTVWSSTHPPEYNPVQSKMGFVSPGESISFEGVNVKSEYVFVQVADGDELYMVALT